MNARSLIIWGITLVMSVALLVYDKVNGQREYDRGYEAAMKEAFSLGLAEKVFHTEHGTIYSFLPNK